MLNLWFYLAIIKGPWCFGADVRKLAIFCTKKDDEFEVNVSLKKFIIIMGSDIYVVADYLNNFFK